ncbi:MULTISPECIES: LysR substrate-binding domain-containing protein [Kordiimonas]|jgi:LysR family glycine cleavage system transcriptional activator|uniref:LysR family transcriptional regulator, glycine cleavage system transcriptional activator n=1 Tax=Kordiimonas lacus TaxID=637679 RepID=A0A1G7EWI0_9PROT|nr:MULTISPECIES: LysR substrate-binding domain-containing protein [Kordiimonas]SDE68053.1 LysR family transcriptional regulator, glycine cleavage system transcriptional activator [Kordiimonas lacus]
MRYKLQSLSGLLAFDAAARHGSLTLAAKELGRTQSAVSQQVKGLEEQLGFALFVRKPREIELTSAGRSLAKAVKQALEGIDDKVTTLMRRHEPNVIRLSAYHSFAIQWLIPRLPRFSMAHPEIDIRLNADDHQVDVVAEGYDLAIRGGWLGKLPAGVTPMRVEKYMPVYAPCLADGREITVNELADYPLIGYEDRSYWNGWLEHNGVELEDPDFGKTYSHSGLLVQAAVVGAGIGMAPLATAAQALIDGRLRCVPGKPSSNGFCFHAVTAGDPVSENVALFIDWLQEEMDQMEVDLQQYIA